MTVTNKLLSFYPFYPLSFYIGWSWRRAQKIPRSASKRLMYNKFCLILISGHKWSERPLYIQEVGFSSMDVLCLQDALHSKLWTFGDSNQLHSVELALGAFALFLYKFECFKFFSFVNNGVFISSLDITRMRMPFYCVWINVRLWFFRVMRHHYGAML